MVLGCLRPRCLFRGGAPRVLTLAVLACAAGMIPTASADPDTTDVLVPFSVSVDVRPGLCPNHLRIESPLTIPIAILSTVNFEASLVNGGTVRLSREGMDGQVRPVSWVHADVGTPLIGGVCACHKLRGDGLDDLEFRFSIEDIATTLGLEEHSGDLVRVVLSGKLMTGEEFEGIDCVEVISGHWADDESEEEIGMLTETGEESAVGPYEFAYYTTVSDRITFAIYDVRGQLVAQLTDMDMAPGIYRVTWDGLTPKSEKAPAGIYFARVHNSWTSDTRKITIP